jgi:hypothetical protein
LPSSAGITGSGTTNYVPKFTGTATVGNSQFFDNGTSVGLGTTTPASTNKLQVINTSTVTGTHGIQAISGAAATGSISTLPSAIYGSSANGHALMGVSDSATGVIGSTKSTTWAGVEGYSSATGGWGVFGSATGAAGWSGGFSGTNAHGIYAEGSTDEAIGLGGFTFNHIGSYIASSTTSTSNVSNALVVLANNSTLENHGIHAMATSNGATANVGLWGQANPTTSSTGGSYGVYGYAANGSTNYGVYGRNVGTGYAGYFNGSVQVVGTLSKGGGTFKIDHPLDPENKYLYHSFVESPDMMNIYNGNITTDVNGDATVAMPSYFDALNKDFRYQLTVIGTFAQAIVRDEMYGNTFSIKTDKPNVKVSWQVTGVRKDKFADAHRVVPEVEKEQQFKGRYLHASEWGMPQSKSIDELTQPKGIAEKETGQGNSTKRKIPTKKTLIN